MSTLVAINLSSGGVPKLPVPSATVGPLGIEGDKQRNTRLHGGPARALCLYTLEAIERLRGEGHPISPGSTGENLTLAGLEPAAMRPGVRLQIGDAVQIEITSYTVPCKNIAESFTFKHFQRADQRFHPGDSRVYARVLQGGTVAVGDPVQVLPA